MRGVETVGLGLNLFSCFLPAHLLPPPASLSFLSLVLSRAPHPTPGFSRHLPSLLPGPQRVPPVPQAMLHGDCQQLNPAETGSFLIVTTAVQHPGQRLAHW